MAQLNDFSKITHNGNEIGRVLHQGKTIWQPGVYLAQDSDFIERSTDTFRYIGTKQELVIPNNIQGVDVINYGYMFDDAYSVNVTKVANLRDDVDLMNYMFQKNPNLTHLDLTGLKTDVCRGLGHFLRDCPNLVSVDMSTCITTSLANVYAMFYNCPKLETVDISSMDLTTLRNTPLMFGDCPSLETVYVRSQADADKIKADSSFPSQAQIIVKGGEHHSDFVKVNGYWIYRGAELEVEIPTHINGELVTSTSYMFNGSSSYQATPVTKVVLNHSNVTNMRYMFTYSKATTLDLSSFNTSNVTDMYGMFEESKATTLDLSSFNTSNVISVRHMFRNSSATIGYARTQADADKFNESFNKPAGLNFVVKYSDFVNVNGNWIYKGTELEVEIPTHINGELVTSTRYMFSGDATPVTKVILNHSNVVDMSNMFSGSGATTLDLSSFNTSNVTDMNNMFSYSSATTLDLSSFDTSNVTDMYDMFYLSNATILDLSSFDTSNVTNMLSMFEDSKATIGYARTQADANKFNESLGKPAGLNFTVKPSSTERLDNGTYTFDANEFKYSDDGYEKNWSLKPFLQYQREYKRVTVTVNGQNIFISDIYSSDGSEYFDPDIKDANSVTFISTPIDGIVIAVYGDSNTAILNSVTIEVSSGKEIKEITWNEIRNATGSKWQIIPFPGDSRIAKSVVITVEQAPGLVSASPLTKIDNYNFNGSDVKLSDIVLKGDDIGDPSMRPYSITIEYSI